MTKATYQNRARNVVVLFRLDLNGPPHRNPDGFEIECPHLHIYRENYGDKWAYPVPTSIQIDSGNLLVTFESFMRHCNITVPPRIMQAGLF